MKHIKLFEAFNSYDLPNFRVELVKPGMSEGKYLFSMADGNGISYWGVFDLEGLRKLEEDMKTMCIIEELQMEIIYKGGNIYGPIDWAKDWTKIVVNKVPDNVKYLNLVEGFPSPSGKVTKINELHFRSVEASVEKPEITGRFEPGDIIETYPAETNTLWFADHSWSHIYSIKKGEFDNYFINKNNTFPEQWSDSYYPPLGYRYKDPSIPLDLENNSWVPITLKDVEPYMSSIIDGGVTKGFLKIVDKMKQIQGKERPWPVTPSKKGDLIEKELKDLLYPLLDELTLLTSSNKYSPPWGSPEWGEAGSQKRKDLIKTIKEKKQKDAQPLITKIEAILKSYKGKVSQEYMDQCTNDYQLIKNRLFM